MSEKAKKKLRDLILAEAEKGNIVFRNAGELMVTNLDEFITQPIDGILYDLNRLPEVVLTWIDDPKWINDFAVSQTIRKLKSLLDEKTEVK